MELLVEIVLAIIVATLWGLADAHDRKMGREPWRIPPPLDIILEIIGAIF
jgi:hypothetical protein